MLQSVVLYRSKFTPQEALDWIKDHNYKYSKIDITPHTIRFRQKSPELLKAGYTVRTIPVGDIGFLVMGYTK